MMPKPEGILRFRIEPQRFIIFDQRILEIIQPSVGATPANIRSRVGWIFFNDARKNCLRARVILFIQSPVSLGQLRIFRGVEQRMQQRTSAERQAGAQSATKQSEWRVTSKH